MYKSSDQVNPNQTMILPLSCKPSIPCPMLAGCPINKGQSPLTWSLDLYMQMNARLRRQGQPESVVCHRILTKDSFDEIQCSRIESKDEVQKDLRSSVSHAGRVSY
jgi:hypothetical protein